MSLVTWAAQQTLHCYMLLTHFLTQSNTVEKLHDNKNFKEFLENMI